MGMDPANRPSIWIILHFAKNSFNTREMGFLKRRSGDKTLVFTLWARQFLRVNKLLLKIVSAWYKERGLALRSRTRQSRAEGFPPSLFVGAVKRWFVILSGGRRPASKLAADAVGQAVLLPHGAGFDVVLTHKSSN